MIPIPRRSMFQRLLFCTDLSDGINRLAHFVPSLAAAGVKQITFLHSVPYDGGTIPRPDAKAIAAAKAQLEVALENVPAGVNVAVEIESGRPSDAILRIAKQTQADLIVLGMPIRSQVWEKLFGSTAMAVCQNTTTPIMVFRPQLLSTYTSEELVLRCQHLFRGILIPYDGSDSAKHVVELVKQRVVDCPSPKLELCHLCWVVEDAGRRGVPPEYFTEPARKALEEAKIQLEAVGVGVEAEVRQGDPLLELLLVAQMANVSAIATSSNSMGKLQELSIPSFTRELLHRSWYPIIYFPSRR